MEDRTFFDWIEHSQEQQLARTLHYLRQVQPEQAEAKAQETLLFIKKLVQEAEPLQLICSLSAYHLTTIDHSVSSELKHPNKLQQSQLELLQALLLTSGLDYFHPHPQGFSEREEQALVESLHFLSIIWSAARMAKSTDTPANKFLELVRGHTQFVRNWAYPHQIRDISKGILSGVDDDVFKALKVKPSLIVDLLFKMESVCETRLIEFFEQTLQLVSKVLSAKSRSAAIKAYENFVPGFRSIDTRKLDLQGLKQMAKSYIDHFLPSVFRFDLQDIASLYGESIGVEDLRIVLNMYSLTFGALKEHNVEHIFLTILFG